MTRKFLIPPICNHIGELPYCKSRKYTNSVNISQTGNKMIVKQPLALPVNICEGEPFSQGGEEYKTVQCTNMPSQSSFQTMLA